MKQIHYNYYYCCCFCCCFWETICNPRADWTDVQRGDFEPLLTEKVPEEICSTVLKMTIKLLQVCQCRSVKEKEECL